MILLTLDPTIRLGRLKSRETARYGTTIERGGPNEATHREFYAWASGYDDPEFAGRSRAGHKEWLAALSCPVLRLDSQEPVARQLEAVTTWLESGPLDGLDATSSREPSGRD